MPTFEGASPWLNSPPLSPQDVAGNVVLVNFWTLTCINWLRTAAHVRAWAQAYRDDGLIVVGVHTPEFAFEHDTNLVRQAIRTRQIGYPVALDNDYAIWRSFHNNYWPALYFLDRDQSVADHHYGEGSYAECEQTLQRLLGVQRPLAPVHPSGVEVEADWANLHSPETYLGSDHSAGLPRGSGAGDGKGRVLRLNGWSLEGDWDTTGEMATLKQAGGQIRFRFLARDAHLVLSSRAGAPAIAFRVLLDGQPPGASHGADVDAAGHGVLRDGRLYQLVRATGPVREQTLSITFEDAGAQAYAFTFG
jgi:thiol-disulfide isomerase/thioredoxin